MGIVFVAIIFIILDFVTGMIKAFYLKQFTSATMRQGLFHKLGSIISIILGYLLNYSTNYVDFELNIDMGACICGYIILMEACSIIENIGQINPDILPPVIRNYFTKPKEGDKNDKSDKIN